MDTNYFLLSRKGESDPEAAHYAGGKRIMHFRAVYIEPYGKMTLIKSYQLLEHRIFPFGESGCAVIDITEWIGHEDEEYIDAFIKFLHDAGRHLFVFTAESTKKQALPLFLRLRCFFPLTMVERRSSPEILAAELCRSYGLELDAAELLAELVSQMKLPESVGTAEIIRQIISEISSENSTDINAVLSYAHREDSLIRLFLGEEIVDEFTQRKEYRYAV